ncbi:hypothetical protein E3D81_14015 [Sphingobacterium sp. CZ-2]|nr:hypothetical protein E3D81_14015 [Sphingobacterium sp. CZ-2]
MIKRRLLGDAFKENPPFLQKSAVNKISINKSVFNFFNDDKNIRLVLTGKPIELDKIKSKFYKNKNDLDRLLNYTYFNVKGKYDTKNISKEFVDRYSSFHLTNNLGIKTCIYCNRNYTDTITSGVRINKFKNKKIPTRLLISRPTLDHWFPKSEYPILAISFFNLIPTCSTCNSSVKGKSSLNLVNHFHPYFKNPNVDRQLNYQFNFNLDDPNKANIIIDSKNDFTRSSIREYSIDKLYSNHNDELQSLMKLKKHFGRSYLNNLSNILEDTDITANEMQRIIFGYSTDNTEDILKRPLSKFRSDILKKLGIFTK